MGTSHDASSTAAATARDTAAEGQIVRSLAEPAEEGEEKEEKEVGLEIHE